MLFAYPIREKKQSKKIVFVPRTLVRTWGTREELLLRNHLFPRHSVRVQLSSMDNFARVEANTLTPFSISCGAEYSSGR